MTFWAVLALQVLIGYWLQTPWVLMTIVLTLAAYATADYYVIQRPQDRLNSSFKQAVLPRVFHYLAPGGRYETLVSRSSLDRNLVGFVFNVNIDAGNVIVRAEDRFRGKRLGIPFDFFELQIIKRVVRTRYYTDSQGRSRQEQYAEDIEYFNGLQVHSQFLDTGYRGVTYVLDKCSDRPSGLGIPDNFQLIKLESPEFNRFFEVYSTDQIEARIALQTNLMYELTEFTKSYPGTMDVVIKPQDVEIFLGSGHDYFELTEKTDLADINSYIQFLAPIDRTLDLIEILNTNRQDRFRK